MQLQVPFMALAAIVARYALAAPTAGAARLSVEPRDLEAPKQYFHVDSNILDKRQSEPIKQYFHIDGHTLDKRQQEVAKQ